MDRLWAQLRPWLAGRTGWDFSGTHPRPVGGGCVNGAYLLESTASGRERVFVKVNAVEKLAMFEAEAEGLAELEQAKAIRVPRVIGHGAMEGWAFLALEALPLVPRRDEAGQRALGEGLAALHRVPPQDGLHGWHRDNTIGELPQGNSPAASWMEFFRDQRLAPQFALAARKGRPIPRAARLLGRLPELLGGHEPPPRLLHGDLWSGNVAFHGQTGEPVIFDPAVYYGDRETDLAFTELFGGFESSFYQAYHESHPLPEGHERRRELYNLYHIVNHANHFGGGYAARAARMVDRLLLDA